MTSSLFISTKLLNISEVLPDGKNIAHIRHSTPDKHTHTHTHCQIVVFKSDDTKLVCINRKLARRKRANMSLLFFRLFTGTIFVSNSQRAKLFLYKNFQ